MLFKKYILKPVRLGSNYQVDEVPLLTDVQNFDYLQNLEKFALDNTHLMWDPSRISSDALGKTL